MIRRIRFGIGCFLIVTTFTLVSAAQSSPEPATAPMPSSILTARKLFISNIGADAPSWVFFRDTGMPNAPYQSFYTAMKASGRFILVDDPAQADLVAEIHFRVDNEPNLGLSLIDAKTHFTLWTLLQPVGGAFRKATWRKNYLAGVQNLMLQLKQITTQ